MRDMIGREMNVEVPRILAAMEQAQTRTVEKVIRDRMELQRCVDGWSPFLSMAKEAQNRG